MSQFIPEKVFVLENGEYKEITYQEFCIYRKTEDGYRGKCFIAVHRMLMEVTKKDYKAFYKELRREKYQYERRVEKKDLSYEILSTSELNGLDVLVSPESDVSQIVEKKLIVEKLYECLEQLPDEDRELIKAMFFEGMTEREYARMKGVYHNAIHKQKKRILKKLKNLLKNFYF